MWFSKKQKSQLLGAGVASQLALHAAHSPAAEPNITTTTSRGDAAELLAAAHLQRAGLTLVERNFRTPGRGGGEIDLVMRAADRTLVFVEVRLRASYSHGGAGASIGKTKQQRIVLAARHYLMRFPSPPPCRFDVVLIHGAPVAGAEASQWPIEWLPAAFDAD